MAFEGLSQKLSAALGKLTGRGKLTEQTVKEGVREVRVALLEADVNYLVVKDFCKRITERCVGQQVLDSLTPGQQVVKIVAEEMTELMARLGLGERVRLLGQRPIAEIRGLMADCLCLVAPSECEEIGPVSLLEAQALGKPAIVSDRGVLPDRVKDGRTGLIFPAGDSLALAQRLDDLAALSQAEYERMSGCAREEAAARYAPSAFAARIIALSERLADEHPSGEEQHGQTTAE